MHVHTRTVVNVRFGWWGNPQISCSCTREKLLTEIILNIVVKQYFILFFLEKSVNVAPSITYLFQNLGFL